jgi:bacterioferritin (cytochrome b1)
VHQQFIHVLAFRAWGDTETADRIYATDKVDFPNVMRIIDHIVATGVLPQLCDAAQPFTAHLPATGATYKSILATELEMERRLIEAISAAQIDLAGHDSPTASALIEGALPPRRSYAAWLAQRLSLPLDGPEPSTLPFGEATASLNALLARIIVTIEQSLVHAFVFWHAGERVIADAAWATSGAAMVQATSLVNLFATHRSVPSPATALSGSLKPPRIGRALDEVIALESVAAEQCRDAAQTAAECLERTEAGRVCLDLAAYYDELRLWQPGQAHPAADNPPAFHSFERTLRTYVQPSGEPGTGAQTRGI